MWETVSAGRSGARVTRRNGVYRKESDDPATDPAGEGNRLLWLRRHGIPAAEVLDCRPGLLVTAAVPGRSAAAPWPAEARERIIDALAELTVALHALPVAGCPYDRRLAVTIPEALAADIDLGNLDAERRGWSRDRLIARLLSTRPQHEDLVVCHGDLSLPNILLDPVTDRVSGVIDAGRLGAADRWADLAIITRSMTSRFGSAAADRYLDRYGVDPNPQKTDFYRLLDEFF
ncbi:aminoglycoside phosphotransferase APH(3') [Actinoplanes philippinensis]|uniref:Kanamycin kinase n=2 Tax=Actinoplanes philippinensis TaxID=35752 RepID=A0A1I2L6P9_9ACTN|nr:APH(3') family aminoglycoside O-phosphotransferase [Actinoplanes philippinensis]GIE82476.1 aminoglycoside phosphotransferase APH(3') [Actinoplanes philippinensis]SFF74160.1 kanamycin kinase [Actinoplanes philippinensis]